MKNLIFTFLLFCSINSFAQDIFKEGRYTMQLRSNGKVDTLASTSKKLQLISYYKVSDNLLSLFYVDPVKSITKDIYEFYYIIRSKGSNGKWLSEFTTMISSDLGLTSDYDSYFSCIHHEDLTKLNIYQSNTESRTINLKDKLDKYQDIISSAY